MQRMTEKELTARIQLFLDKKMHEFPELRAETKKPRRLRQWQSQTA